jgi:hypothetical protein
MSRSLARHRTGFGNPESAVGEALPWVGGTALVGAALSATAGAVQAAGTATGTNIAYGALAGASGGSGLAAIGGIIVALVSPKNRNAGLAAIGLGLGGSLLFGFGAGMIAAKSVNA